MLGAPVQKLEPEGVRAIEESEAGGCEDDKGATGYKDAAEGGLYRRLGTPGA